MKKDIPLERTITTAIMRYLKTLAPRGWFFKAHGGTYQSAGIPDIVGVYREHAVYFEVKRPEVGRLSALQDATIDRINAAGGVACVVRSVDEVRAVIAQIDRVCEKWP